MNKQELFKAWKEDKVSLREAASALADIWQLHPVDAHVAWEAVRSDTFTINRGNDLK